MPRASWKGFLRLSLVSCPIYLSPATTRTKSIRLHQVWQPKATRASSEDVEEEGQPSQDAGRSYNDDMRLPLDPVRLVMRFRPMPRQPAMRHIPAAASC